MINVHETVRVGKNKVLINKNQAFASAACPNGSYWPLQSIQAPVNLSFRNASLLFLFFAKHELYYEQRI